jgi:hypothetical protein|tara:strand:- start:1869 stop:2249 length:381 start_codon:yes stop_codon:yes gene_type:complete
MSFLTKILGLDKIKEINKAKDQEQNKQLSAKDLATKKKQPWVGVIDTHINKENVRNGFFELDWNDLFIKRLINEGYGVDNDKHEEIVDRWFRELCANVVIDGDFGGPLEKIKTGNLDINNVKRNND